MGRATLEQLARLYGVETGYHDITGAYREANDDALLGLLRAVGAPVAGHDDVEDALRARRWTLASQVSPPVHVLWTDQVPQLNLQILDAARFGPLRVELTGSDGFEVRQDHRLEELEATGRVESEGRSFVSLTVPISEMPPVGYVRAEVRVGSMEARTTLLIAPRRVRSVDERALGVFAPTYALRAEHDRGTGDLSHLARLGHWAAERGAGFVATLPLLATFLGDGPYEPSPYLPVSKRFWNEAFLDLSRLPEVGPDDADALTRLENCFEVEGYVDFKEGYRHLRPFLAACAERAWNGPQRSELEAYVEGRPQLRSYAEFRAMTEAAGKGFPVWTGQPQPDPADIAYHLYVQWRTSQQLQELAASLRSRGSTLYLDLPLGVHPDGYDAWADRDCFIAGYSAGAPPDALAPEGQDWGFRPLHPWRLRERGHDYFAQSIRGQAELAGVLRIDHVMGLHRLYCVPIGGSATDGSYVRCPADELWATVAIEAERHGCQVVGEDLGTVPEEVRYSMKDHGILRMYVAQFEVQPGAEPPITAIPDDVVASINTHDTPTFMGFWHHRDIVERVERKILDEGEALQAHHARDAVRAALTEGLRAEGRVGEDPTPTDILVALLLRMAQSAAPMAIVSLEDLWLEEAPQNVPGTSWERPNWRRRMRLTLEQVEANQEIDGLFRALVGGRRT